MFVIDLGAPAPPCLVIIASIWARCAGVTTAPVYYDYQALLEKQINKRSSFRVMLFGSDDRLDLLIKQVNASHVQTALAGKERFPALVVEKKGSTVVVYDLSALPPVLRTFASSHVTLQSGSQWKHGAAIASYSDAELEAISA